MAILLKVGNMLNFAYELINAIVLPLFDSDYEQTQESQNIVSHYIFMFKVLISQLQIFDIPEELSEYVNSHLVKFKSVQILLDNDDLFSIRSMFTEIITLDFALPVLSLHNYLILQLPTSHIVHDFNAPMRSIKSLCEPNSTYSIFVQMQITLLERIGKSMPYLLLLKQTSLIQRTNSFHLGQIPVLECSEISSEDNTNTVTDEISFDYLNNSSILAYSKHMRGMLKIIHY